MSETEIYQYNKEHGCTKSNFRNFKYPWLIIFGIQMTLLLIMSVIFAYLPYINTIVNGYIFLMCLSILTAILDEFFFWNSLERLSSSKQCMFGQCNKTTFLNGVLTTILDLLTLLYIGYKWNDERGCTTCPFNMMVVVLILLMFMASFTLKYLLYRYTDVTNYIRTVYDETSKTYVQQNDDVDIHEYGPPIFGITARVIIICIVMSMDFWMYLSAVVSNTTTENGISKISSQYQKYPILNIIIAISVFLKERFSTIVTDPSLHKKGMALFDLGMAYLPFIFDTMTCYSYMTVDPYIYNITCNLVK